MIKKIFILAFLITIQAQSAEKVNYADHSKKVEEEREAHRKVRRGEHVCCFEAMFYGIQWMSQDIYDFCTMEAIPGIQKVLLALRNQCCTRSN